MIRPSRASSYSNVFVLVLASAIAVTASALPAAAQNNAAANGGTSAPALVDLTVPAIAISPDGSKIATVLRNGDTQQIYIRPVGDSQGKPVAGTEGAGTPMFSPDGKWLAFFAKGHLNKMPV